MCVYTHTHAHTMEYYLALRKKETLPFVTTWVDREGIVLCEISQTETNKYCMISYVESKRAKLTESESRKVVARGWGVGVMQRCWPKGTNFQL